MALNGTERRAGPGLRLGTAIAACTPCVASTWFLLAAMSHAAWNGGEPFLGAALGLMAPLGLICAIVVRAWRVPVAIAVASVLLLAIGAASGAPLTVRWRASEPAFHRWIT